MNCLLNTYFKQIYAFFLCLVFQKIKVSYFGEIYALIEVLLYSHTDNLSVAKGLKLFDLILSLLLLLKTNIGYKTFFSLS